MLAPDLIPVWSGIGSYAFSLLNRLPDDIEVHVLTTRRKISGSKGASDLSDQQIQNLFSPNIKLHFLSSAENTFSYHLKFQFACLRELPKLNKKHNFAFVHSNFPLMSEIFLHLLRRQKTPFLSTIHTTIEGQHEAVKISQKPILNMEQSDLGNLFLLPALHLAENICLKNSTKLIATSSYIRSELLSHFPFLRQHEIPVIHNGIDDKLFSKKETPNLKLVNVEEDIDLNRSVVLFTGRLVASKGINVLIQAIPSVLKEVSDALFLFAGGGNSADYINLLQRKNVSDESYRFLGYVPDYLNMPDLYSLADVYVMPTLYESFPLRLLESLACENAVVASNVCGVPEVIKPMENGILVPPGKPDAVADGIITFLQDDKLRLSAGKNARQTIRDGFSADVMASKTLAVYEQLFSLGANS